MTNFPIPVSPQVMRALGWTLLHFVWQGAALVAVLSVLLACCRRPSARYWFGVGTLILMLAAPLTTFLLLLDPSRPSLEWTRMVSAGAREVLGPTATAAAQALPALPTSRSQFEALAWLVEVWFAGVVLFSLRAGGGFFVIHRLKRRGARPLAAGLCERFQTLRRRLGIVRPVRFSESQGVAAPCVIGFLRPVILLPVAALIGLSEPQLEAVIAHELAHLRRLDPLVNFFQVTVETLLFYHPGVWWASRRVRTEREYCCDDQAILAGGDAILYARALTLMEEWRSGPVLAMGVNHSPLAARVLRLLGLGQMRRGLRGAGLITSSLCLAGALLAGDALWGIAETGLRGSGLSDASPRRGSLVAQPALNVAAPEAKGGVYLLVSQASTSNAAEGHPSAADQDGGPASQPGKEGFIEQMRAAGLENLTVDQLIAMKTQGVTPAYVREMRALGFNVGAEELITMLVQGLTPQYVRDMRARGVRASAEQFVVMKVQGVTPEYVRAMSDWGVKPDAETLVTMRVQGVTPDYFRDMQAEGLKLSPEQAVGMKVQGVTPQYVRRIQELGLKPNAETLITMRVQGVTPEYLEEMRTVGLKLTAEESTTMRVQGVTPEYVKALQAAGLNNLQAEDYVRAKVQGITPEFLEKAQQHGFQNLTLGKLIELRRAGVL